VSRAVGHVYGKEPSHPGCTIQLLDPSTLAPRQSLSLPNTDLSPSFGVLGFGIPTTNDGRTWLAVGALPAAIFSKMAYITPQSLNPTPISTTLQTNFYDGPWYAMSRDGERLIITQTAASSPVPMLYMNAADSVLRVNPAGLTFSYHFSVSEKGDRVLFDNFELRNGAFNLIGDATLPTASPSSQSYYARAGLVTPDGSRVYVLGYRGDAYGNEATIFPRVYVFDGTTPHPNLTSLGISTSRTTPRACRRPMDRSLARSAALSRVRSAWMAALCSLPAMRIWSLRPCQLR